MKNLLRLMLASLSFLVGLHGHAQENICRTECIEIVQIGETDKTIGPIRILPSDDISAGSDIECYLYFHVEKDIFIKFLNWFKHSNELAKKTTKNKLGPFGTFRIRCFNAGIENKYQLSPKQSERMFAAFVNISKDSKNIDLYNIFELAFRSVKAVNR